MHTPSTRTAGARILSVLALVVTAVLFATPAATAYEHIGVSGRPGAVQARQTQGTHLQVACGYGYTGCFAPGLIVNGPTVYRSPASTGTQYVTVRYTVQRWTGVGWAVETYRDFSGTIGAGQGAVTTQTWQVMPNTAGYKYTNFSIVWSDAYGRVLGTSRVAMNGNDYGCATRFTFKCTAYTGSVAVYTP